MLYLRNLFKLTNIFQPHRTLIKASSLVYPTSYRFFSTKNPLKPENSYIEDGLASTSNGSDIKDQLNMGFNPFNLDIGLVHFEKVLNTFSTQEDASLLSAEDKNHFLQAYYEIGQIYEKQRRIIDALNKYIKALETAEQINMSKSAHAGSINNALGRVYLKQYKFREAGIHLDKAMEIFKQSGGNVSDQIIRNRYMTGVLYEFEGDLDKALELFNGIISSQKAGEVASDEDFNISLVYQHMGNIYLAKGDSSKAREYWTESIDRFVKTNRNDLNEALLFCLDLMNNLVRLQEYDEAIFFADRCLGYCEKFLQSNDPKLADVLVKVAPIYTYKRGSPKAIEILQRAVDIYTSPENIQQHHEQAAFTYIRMSEIHLSQSREELSQACFDKAIKIATQALGENHHQIGDHYSFWGDLIRDKVNDSERASTAYEKALDIYTKAGRGYEPKVITTCYKLGVLNFDEDELDDCLVYFNKGLDHSIEHLKCAPKMLQEIYDYIATTLFRQEKYKEAVEYFLKAGEAWTDVGDADAFNFVDEYYQNLGHAYEDKGLLAEATDFYQKALEMAAKNRGDQKDVIQYHLKLVLSGLQRLGRSETAGELQKMYG